jgi:hypothetical protein
MPDRGPQDPGRLADLLVDRFRVKGEKRAIEPDFLLLLKRGCSLPKAVEGFLKRDYRLDLGERRYVPFE